MKTRPSVIVSLGMTLILLHCAPVSKMSYSNLAYLYDSEQNVTQLECVAHHISEDMTSIHFRFLPNELLYERRKGKNYFVADFSIRYELFDSYNSRMLIDSGIISYSDSLFYESESYYYSSFPVKTIYPGEYALTVTLTDLKRKYSFDTFVEMRKKSLYSQQNFLLLDESGNPLFTSHIESFQVFSLRCRDPGIKKLYVRYFLRDFPIAAPPFAEEEESTFDYLADSSFTVDVVDGETGLFLFEKEGFYQFQPDTLYQEGATVFRFYDGYPYVVTPQQMLYPLRYLTTKKEYEKMAEQDNTRQAVEDFWLSNAGNHQRATQMIRKFYTRVEEANKLFTAYLEGWKTDRGLIYIIFGRPTVVYRYRNVEQWIYGQEGNLMSLTFHFTKVVNPFTENDYRLIRSSTYKESWYMAVDTWRR